MWWLIWWRTTLVLDNDAITDNDDSLCKLLIIYDDVVGEWLRLITVTLLELAHFTGT